MRQTFGTPTIGVIVAILVLLIGSVATAQTPFRIVEMTGTNPQAVDAQPYISDDRGGIAVSTSHVFARGDGGTCRAELSNLANPSNVGNYDAGFTNLADNGLWHLLSGSNLATTGGTITGAVLLTPDGSAVTSTTITFSQALTFTTGTYRTSGVFAGWNVLILYSDSTSRFYAVDLTTGTVTDLGVRSRPTWQTSEQWACWGVAEYDGTDYWVVYKQSGVNQFVRYNITTQATQNVAQSGITALADLASWVVSPANGRWYGRLENSSQFGSFSEPIVSAEFSFSVKPSVRLDGSNTDYTSGSFMEGAAPTSAVGSSVAVNGGQIDSMTITMTNPQDGAAEQLNVSTAGTTITAAGNGTDVITLTGPAPGADFQTVLATLTYENTSDNPTDSPARSIVVLATEGSTTSDPATATIAVIAVNDPPMVTLPADGDQTWNTTVTFTATGATALTVNDADAGTADLAVSLTVTEGTLTLATTAGISITSGADGSSMVAFTGPLSAVQAAIDGLAWAPTTDFTGSAMLTASVDDQGNAGTGGAMTGMDSLTLNMQPARSIRVEIDGTEVAHDGTVDLTTFGGDASDGLQPGDSIAFTVEIFNDGLESLTISTDPTVAGGASVTQDTAGWPSLTVASGASISSVYTIAGSSNGSFAVQVNVQSDAENHPNYVGSITGVTSGFPEDDCRYQPNGSNPLWIGLLLMIGAALLLRRPVTNQ